jgi:hypothetical protein
MKKLWLISTGIAFLAACSPHMQTNISVIERPAPPPTAPPAAFRPQITFQRFYDELAPYGTWIDYPGEGYVWRPNVDPDFRPYATDGHWVYSSEGWTWASEYPWGWAAFHYGRWFHEDGYGWLWLPGDKWAPAWVTWGHSGDYYGWAPLAPHIENGSGWNPPANTWNFVPGQHITKPDVIKYVVVNNSKTVINNITKNVTIINNITNNHVTSNQVTSNMVINKGPDVHEVENITKAKIDQVEINEGSKPGKTVINNNNIMIYRPLIKANENVGPNKFAPHKVENYKRGQQ